MNKDTILQGILVSVLGGIVISAIVGVSALVFSEMKESKDMLDSEGKKLTLAITRIDTFNETFTKLNMGNDQQKRALESSNALIRKALDIINNIETRLAKNEDQLSNLESLLQHKVTATGEPSAKEKEALSNLKDYREEIKDLRAKTGSLTREIPELTAEQRAQLMQIEAQQQALRMQLKQQHIQQQAQQQQ